MCSRKNCRPKPKFSEEQLHGEPERHDEPEAARRLQAELFLQGAIPELK